MPVVDKLKSLYKRLPWMFKPLPIPGITKFSEWADALRALGVPISIEHEYIFLKWEERIQKIDAELLKLKRTEHNQQDLFKDLDGDPKKFKHLFKIKIENLEKEKKDILELLNGLAEDLIKQR